MSSGEIIALVGLVVTLVSIVCGAAWWASALYARVKEIDHKLDDVIQRGYKERRGISKNVDALEERVADHAIQLIKLTER
jgi:hypothetical protein|tara:strand:+ start:793 stop:1032 length:240 start_codon:yes stop_codon:yes gene_type:complete